MCVESRLGNPFEKKTHFPSFFAGPGPRPGPGPPGPGPGPCEEGWKIYINGALFAIFGRASGQILVKMRVLARQGHYSSPTTTESAKLRTRSECCGFATETCPA